MSSSSGQSAVSLGRWNELLVIFKVAQWRFKAGFIRNASVQLADHRSLSIARWVQVDHFGNTRKRNLDNLTICAFNLHAWRCQRLRSFHAADDAAHALSIGRNDLDIIFAVQGLKGRKGLGYFHDY